MMFWSVVSVCVCTSLNACCVKVGSCIMQRRDFRRFGVRTDDLVDRKRLLWVMCRC